MLRRVATISYDLGFALVIELMALAAIASASLYLSGYSLTAVQTGSMVPTFRIGDALITKKTTASATKVGDIISYASPKSSRVTISHRVVSLSWHDGTLLTQGDHLKQPDTAISTAAIRAKVVAVVPKAGYIIDVARSTVGIIVFCVCLLATAAAEFYRLGRQQQRLHYHL